jgi:hypothetical protein
MHLQCLFGRLDFHDDQPADNQIRPESRTDSFVPVLQRQNDLSLKRDFTFLYTDSGSLEPSAV